MIELQLPPEVSAGAVSLDDWNTQTNVLPNGKQQRIALQSKTLGRWTINYTAQTKTAHVALRNFKLAVKGSFHSWRFKDWADYESDTQQSCSPATGNGVVTQFQLQKTYTVASPGTSYVRTITKPVASTVAVYKNDVLQTLTTHYTLNSATGVITFVTPPTNGHTIKATFEFDKPAHFVNDDNSVTVIQDAGDLSSFDHDSMEVEEVDEI